MISCSDLGKSQTLFDPDGAHSVLDTGKGHFQGNADPARGRPKASATSWWKRRDGFSKKVREQLVKRQKNSGPLPASLGPQEPSEFEAPEEGGGEAPSMDPVDQGDGPELWITTEPSSVQLQAEEELLDEVRGRDEEEARTSETSQNSSRRLIPPQQRPSRGAFFARVNPGDHQIPVVRREGYHQRQHPQIWRIWAPYEHPFAPPPQR